MTWKHNVRIVAPDLDLDLDLDHREISLLLAGRSQRSEGGAGSFPLAEYYTEETDWSSGAVEQWSTCGDSPVPLC